MTPTTPRPRDLRSLHRSWAALGRRWLRGALGGLFAALCWVTSTGGAEAPAVMTHIERYGSESSARLVLHLSRPVTFQLGSSSAPSAGAPRLHVDLPGVTYSGRHAFDVGGLVERLRVLPFESGLRLVLDATGRARHRAFYLPSPYRIVVDVSQPQAEEQAGALGAVRRARRVERIALDPGHGGSDSGAKGRHTGIEEKDIVLDIAHRAAPLLARELGVSTLLTRDTDERVPLEQRVAQANAFGADLFVSIHCNADPSRSARGVMTFVLGRSPEASLGSALEREGAAPADDAVALTKFLEQFDGTEAAARSIHFAHLLQRSALASLAAGYADAVDGGVHGAGFYVLAGARMPAVLFETSFVSNGLEERRLSVPRYRQKLADAIVNAVRAYKSGY